MKKTGKLSQKVENMNMLCKDENNDKVRENGTVERFRGIIGN